MPIQTAKLLLKFDPDSELTFKGPYLKPTTVSLKLKSISNKIVAFKVKTTAPKFYSVVPTHGYIRPDSEISIYLTYNGDKHDYKLSKNKHKFLVQATLGPEDVTTALSPDCFWKEIINKKDAMIFEHKLRCLFDNDDKISNKSGLSEQAGNQRQQFKSLIANKENSSIVDQISGQVISVRTTNLDQREQQNSTSESFSLKTFVYVACAALMAMFAAVFPVYSKANNSRSSQANQTSTDTNALPSVNQQPREIYRPTRYSIKTLAYVACASMVVISAYFIYWMRKNATK